MDNSILSFGHDPHSTISNDKCIYDFLVVLKRMLQNLVEISVTFSVLVTYYVVGLTRSPSDTEETVPQYFL